MPPRAAAKKALPPAQIPPHTSAANKRMAARKAEKHAAELQRLVKKRDQLREGLRKLSVEAPLVLTHPEYHDKIITDDKCDFLAEIVPALMAKELTKQKKEANDELLRGT
ncbi:hypothetical protein FRC11_011277 [Ceratobasidium sp. 423]|nr:hypothetical protein FRC11_011277 [Ceratobasidium sp. 423]